MILGGWTTKPPAGTPINWLNPITRGLSWYAPINEGAGPVCGYDAGGRQFVPTVTGTPVWVSSPQGMGIQLSASNWYSWAANTTTELANPNNVPLSALYFGSAASATTRTDCFGQWTTGSSWILTFNQTTAGKISLVGSG